MSRRGTPEESWAVWRGLATLPELPRPTGRIVVISAHPDDEVLGAGGLIASLVRTSDPLSFVTVTDGEASHPDSASRSSELAPLRSAELVKALRLLGLERPEITRLRIPDSEVAEYVDLLAAGIDRTVNGADLVICPAAEDGHPDHAVVGRVTGEVCRGRIPVLEFPIWMWHWTVPGDEGHSWGRARRFELSAVERRAKAAAIACFTTQIEPYPGGESGTTVLPPEVLDHFGRPFEVFLT